MSQLHVPIGVKRIVLLDVVETANLKFESAYIHCNKKRITMYSGDNGSPLLILEGIEVMPTSRDRLRMGLKRGEEEIKMPALYEQAWLPVIDSGDINITSKSDRNLWILHGNQNNLTAVVADYLVNKYDREVMELSRVTNSVVYGFLGSNFQ